MFANPSGQVIRHAAVAQRADWIDAARGLGIALVVLGHCLRGLVAAGLVPDGPAFQTVDRAIYAFHMPLFFLLSGLLFEKSWLQRTFPDFLLRWGRRLLWPLVLWTWVFFLFRTLSGGLANQVVSWDSFPWNPLPPQAHLWFLWAMFLIGIAVHALRPVWRAAGRSIWVWWVAFAATVLLSWQVPPLGDLAEWLVPAFLFAPCLIAGLLLQRLSGPAPGTIGTLLSLAVFAGAVMAGLMLPTERAVALAVALVAPVALAQGVRGVTAAGLPLGGLALLGRASMAIFLAHTIFSAGLRIALVRLGLDDPTLHIVAGTLIGLAGPLLIWHLARRTGTDRWLGF